jgi:hypothetical protein
MGAWGHLFDENDDAADWLDEFSDAPNWTLVDETLGRVKNGDYLEAPDCSQTLAAAEVVAAGLGRPSPRLPTEVIGWAQQHATEASQLRDSAKSALARIRDESELQELWQEADEFSDWRQSVDETISRLA